MKHPALQRIKKTIVLFLLITAIAHLSIMFVHSVSVMDFWHFNYFSVLDLQLFFPNITKGPVSFALASVVMLCVIAVIYLHVDSQKEPHKKNDDEQSAQ